MLTSPLQMANNGRGNPGLNIATGGIDEMNALLRPLVVYDPAHSATVPLDSPITPK